MSKHLILTLEYDFGDITEDIEEGYEPPTDPKDIGLQESFYQSDVCCCDLEIIGVKVKEIEGE